MPVLPVCPRAWDLAQAGHSVTVYEAQGQPGGLASGFRDDNWDWSLEKFYHHWFEGDEALIDLAEEIGIDDKVFFRHGKTSMWLEGDIVRSEIEPTSVLKLPISFRGLIPFALFRCVSQADAVLEAAGAGHG